MTGVVGVMVGITGGWFERMEKEHTPLLTGLGRFAIGKMLKYGWVDEEATMLTF